MFGSGYFIRSLSNSESRLGCPTHKVDVDVRFSDVELRIGLIIKFSKIKTESRDAG